MSRKITLNIKGESKKQYSTLVLELSVMAKSWKKFGVDIKLPGQEKIVEWGRKSHKEATPEAPN
jgi:hypothetical protein|tara:strand:+ start:730 stop:921 length:192 start_codon:yes stop_codon:yes gene_type:complete